jgi:hypothetical protein
MEDTGGYFHEQLLCGMLGMGKRTNMLLSRCLVGVTCLPDEEWGQKGHLWGK